MALVDGRILLAPIFRWIYRVEVVGVDRVPDHGATLFVANHSRCGILQ